MPLLSDSLFSVGFSMLACSVSCFVRSLRIDMRRETGQLYFEKSVVVSPDPCLVPVTREELF